MSDPLVATPCRKCGQTDWIEADAQQLATITETLRQRVPELETPDRAVICSGCGNLVTDHVVEFRAPEAPADA